MSITTRPPATAWIGVTCTDDRLRGLHRRHYSSEKSGRRRGRPVEHPNQLRMIGVMEELERLRFAKKGALLRRAEEAERQRDLARAELAAVYVALEKIGLAVRQHPAFEVLTDRTHP